MCIFLSVGSIGLLRGVTVTSSGLPNSDIFTPPILRGFELTHDFPPCAKPVGSDEMKAPPCLKYAAPGPEIPTCMVILFDFNALTADCKALTDFVAASACDFTVFIALENEFANLLTAFDIEDM